MVLIKAQAGEINYVLESTDKVIYLCDFTLVGLGTWTALKEGTEAGPDYVVPAGKTLTIIFSQYYSSNTTGYIDIKYDTSAGSSGGTRIGFPQNILTGTTQDRYSKIDIPTGNYVNIQKNVAQINCAMIGVEHDT
jgi:hypothetical protein